MAQCVIAGEFDVIEPCSEGALHLLNSVGHPYSEWAEASVPDD